MSRPHNATFFIITFLCFITNIYTIVSFLLLEILSNKILILELKVNNEYKDGVIEFKKVSSEKLELVRRDNSPLRINNLNLVNYVYTYLNNNPDYVTTALYHTIFYQ